jgi:hypothetical protein
MNMIIEIIRMAMAVGMDLCVIEGLSSSTKGGLYSVNLGLYFMSYGAEVDRGLRMVRKSYPSQSRDHVSYQFHNTYIHTDSTFHCTLPQEQ